MAVNDYIAQGMQPFNAANTLALAEGLQGQRGQNALLAMQLKNEQNPNSLLNRGRQANVSLAEAQLEAEEMRALVPQLALTSRALAEVLETSEKQGPVAARQKLRERLSFLESKGYLPKGFGLGGYDEKSDEDFLRDVQFEKQNADWVLSSIPQERDAPVVVGPGDTLVNPESGEAIYSAPSKPEEVNPLQEKMTIVANALGRELTDDEILNAAGMLGQGVKDVRDEQIPPTQLDSVRFADGSSPEVGTTWGEAQDQGARVYSASEITKRDSVTRALATLGDLERMALDPENGVFIDEGGSPLTNNRFARILSGVVNGLGALVGTEASERRAIFDATSRGTLSALVRSMGEAGALSDGDVERALELIPSLGMIPDTERQARQQFNELRTIIGRGKAWVDEHQGDGVGQGEVIDIGGGITLEIL